MDLEIRGRAPSAEHGRRFATSELEWDALLYVMHEAGVEVPSAWYDGHGAGPASGEDCRDMAERLEGYLSTHLDNLWTFGAGSARRASGVHGPRVTRERVQAFAAFLRECGGFAVEEA